MLLLCETKTYVSILAMKLVRSLITPLLSLALLIGILNAGVLLLSRPFIYGQQDLVPQADTGLVLGAGLTPDGLPSRVLQDRLDAALRLYRGKKVHRLILSGDTSSVWYDEVGAMQKYLLARGVDPKDLLLDPQGFSTFNSLDNTRKLGPQSLMIFSQQFHLPRAVFLARFMGIDAIGVVSDQTIYVYCWWYWWREIWARPKAVFSLLDFAHFLPWSSREKQTAA